MTDITFDVLELFPPIIQQSPNGSAFAEIIKYFFYGDEDLKTSLSLTDAIPFFDSIEKVYLYSQIQSESIPEETCDLLAYMWNVRGYELAGQYNAILGTSVLDIKRQFIKDALSLKRKEGTPAGIESILLKYGYTNIVITENVSLSVITDGTFITNGKADTSGDLENQLFTVEITSNHDISVVDLTEENAIITMINLYKKYRPDLYQLIIKEPSTPAGRTIQVWSSI